MEEAFFTLDPSLLESLLSPRTKAVMPVHLFGQMADMPAIVRQAEQHGIFILEDAAQAHGAMSGGQKAGSWGQAAAFSFYPTKNLGALGDAGCVVTSNEQLAAAVRRLGNHGQLQKHQHEIAGRNSRTDSLQAAVLKAKLPLLDEWNCERRACAALYRELLAEIPQVQAPQERAGARHVYHLFAIRCQQRDALQTWLQKQGIGTAVHYPRALSAMPVFQAYKGAGNCPVAEKLTGELLSLPLYPGLTEQEIRYVCEQIGQFYS